MDRQPVASGVGLAVAGLGVIGLGLDQRDLDGGAAGHRVAALLADLGVDQRVAERRVGGVHLELAVGDAFLAGGDEERLGVLLVAVVEDGDDGAGQRHTGLLRGLADLGEAEQILQLADTGFLLALLIAGRVVAAVLAEVALFAAVVDLRGDDRAVRDQLVEFGLQALECLFG